MLPILLTCVSFQPTRQRKSELAMLYPIHALPAMIRDNEAHGGYHDLRAAPVLPLDFDKSLGSHAAAP